MISVVALVCCIGVAAASLCCVPPQWEAHTLFLTTIVHNGKATVSKGSTMTAYDGINHKIGQIEEIQLNGASSMYVATLMDYASNTKYIVHDGQCVKTTLNRRVEDFGGCIPDNATITEKDAVYGLGSNAGHVNAYALEYPGVKSYVSLTKDACVPVGETTRGVLQGNYFLENVNYINVTAGISDPTVLRSPPVGCENAPLVPSHYTEGNFNNNLVGKRSFLF